MKKSLLVAIAALFLGTASTQAELTVISTKQREENYFKRLSEYITGDEDPGRYFIVRSNPDERDGFYISLKSDDKKSLKAVSTIRLRFVRPGTQEITTLDLPTSEIKKKRILVGLTEAEWIEPNHVPVAWAVELLDQQGTIVDKATSFLWVD